MHHCQSRQRCLATTVLAGLISISAIQAHAAEHAYVALENAASVAVVDLASGNVVRRIQVGPLPRFVTASADGSVVAVVNEGDQTVSMISVADNAVVETIALDEMLPTFPVEGMESVGAGEMLFEGLPEVDVTGLSAQQRAELAGAMSGNGGWSGAGLMPGAEIGISNDGFELYLPDQLYGLSAYDRRTGETRTFGSQPGNPLTISNYSGVIRLDEQGDRLLVPSHNSVTVFDPETLTPGSIVETRGFLSRPAFEITHDGRRVITPPSFNIGSANVAVEMEMTDLQTFDYRRVEVTGSAPMRQRPSGQPAIPEYRGIWETADTELSPDDELFYAVRSYSMLGDVARLGGGGLGEIGAFRIDTGETVALVDLETEVFGLQTFHDGKYLALVHPAQNRIDVRDAGSLELVRSIDVGPTPRGGQNFVVNATARPASESASMPEPTEIVPSDDGKASSSGIEF